MLSLDVNPTISSNTYFGTISIPELRTNIIPIQVQRTVEIWDSPNDPIIKWKIIPTMIAFRGKERKIIYDTVMNEIIKQNLIL